MACLSQAVPLHDIEDVDKRVSAEIRRLDYSLSVEEREELEGEGLALMWQLEREWSGHGTFSGYVAEFFPLRLVSALRKMRGLSRCRTFDAEGAWTGERAWVRPPVVSLDGELERPGFDENRLGRVVHDRRVAA